MRTHVTFRAERKEEWERVAPLKQTGRVPSRWRASIAPNRIIGPVPCTFPGARVRPASSHPGRDREFRHARCKCRKLAYGFPRATVGFCSPLAGYPIGERILRVASKFLTAFWRFIASPIARDPFLISVASATRLNDDALCRWHRLGW